MTRRLVILIALAALGLSDAASAQGAKAFDKSCAIGLYRLDDGSDVDIGPGADDALRWRRKDGTTGSLRRDSAGRWHSRLGWTERRDGITAAFPDCGSVVFDRRRGKRVAFDVIDTNVAVEGARLAGRLVMPKGTGPVPIVVLVHGAEHDSARDFYALQRQFPSEGIGVFVYDKRGTGGSTGTYTQDYLTLAADLIAATREAKRLAGARAGGIGYQAGSQGGWVAPLAARIEPVRFVIVSFGLAVSALEEDRSAIALDLTRRGYGAADVAKAMEIADASAAILVSGFREGYDRLDAARAKYRAEPWFKYVRGNVTWFLLEKSPQELRELGPAMLPNMPVHYDPMPVLRNLDTPQLWLLGADDIDAPSAETAKRLTALKAAGRPVDLIVYPHAEHGLYEFETAPDGTRISTRQPADYFMRMRDFIVKNAGTAAAISSR